MRRAGWLALVALTASCAAEAPPPAPLPAEVITQRQRALALERADASEAEARRLADTGRFRLAATEAESAHWVRAFQQGDGHADTLRLEAFLAWLYVKSEEDYRIEKKLRTELAEIEAAAGANAPSLAPVLDRLAAIAAERGARTEAEELRRRALAVREAALGPQHPELAGTLVMLAHDRVRMCRPADARPLAERALAILERALGPAHEDLARALTVLADASYIAGDDAAAERWSQRAADVLGPRAAARAEQLVDALDMLARLREARLDFASARALREREIALSEGGRKRWRSVAALYGDLRALGDDPAAEALATRLGLVLRVRDPRAPDRSPRCTPPSNGPSNDIPDASQTVAGMAAAFRRCYNRALEDDAEVRGSIRVTAKIGAGGEVTHAHATSTGSLPRATVACVVDRVMGATFTPPARGGATVVIPLTFVAQ